MRFVALFILTLLVGCNRTSELVWVEEEGYRWASLPKASTWGTDGFRHIPSTHSGVEFNNMVGQEEASDNRNLLNGSGVAIADIDQDGLQDIYFASLQGSNRLYKNIGDFQFVDITQNSGLMLEGYQSTGVIFEDLTGNSFPDVIITSLSQGNYVFLNDGTGYFTKVENSGLDNGDGSMSMSLADVDQDGLLDLYLVNYNEVSVRDLYTAKELDPSMILDQDNEEPTIKPPFDEYYVVINTDDGISLNEIGTSDHLYLNKGNGTFQKAETSSHFLDEHGDPLNELPKDWGLSASFRDITGNGLPDLYVANDFWTPDRIWINEGEAVFRLVSPSSLQNYSYSSMGVAFTDMNRNGLTDIVVTEMLSTKHSDRLRQHSEYLRNYQGKYLYNRNSVYLNRGDTTFSQIAYYSGLESSDWSWSTVFLDIDLDGYEDLLVTNGFLNDYQDMDTQIALYNQDMRQGSTTNQRPTYPAFRSSNKIFKNNGDLTFTDYSQEWGFSTPDISHGMAYADLNNDGYHDLVINRMGDEALIYENRTRKPRIAVRLRGDKYNTTGVGAKITLQEKDFIQSKEIYSGGTYLSSSQKQVVFAAAKEEPYSLTIQWPDGRVSKIDSVFQDRLYEVDISSAQKITPIPIQESRHGSLFHDISAELNHHHVNNRYDDFRFSPLLPFKLSELGPGAAWIDLDNDGLEELFVSASKGETLDAYTVMDDGEIRPLSIESITNSTALGDQTAITGWRQMDETFLIVGHANYEEGNPKAPSATIYRLRNKKVIDTQSISGIRSTTGVIASGDLNGDGYVDLFIGGRHDPGNYPVEATSRIFLNQVGDFVPDLLNSKIVENIGMVTDAIIADITGNGSQDILLSMKWGELRLLENRSGRLVDRTEELGLSIHQGLWNGVAVGDFNNDGRLDIVATNIGENTPYQDVESHPIRLYYGDLDWDGRVDLVEAYYVDELGCYAPMRKLHEYSSIRTILQNVQSHREFATSCMEDIFGERIKESPFKEINTSSTMIFINTGDDFIAQKLPDQAQVTTAHAALVSDFNNDGNEDIFLAQNMHYTRPQMSRQDAGRGLILLGNGKGDFRPLDIKESGINIMGDQRAAVSSDINRDGKTDIVVTQNNGMTRLYKNMSSNQGIKVTLSGPFQNQNAIGSSMQVRYSDNTVGPMRIVNSSSSYWSQSSFTQVIGLDSSKQPSHLEIRWPDGTVNNVEIEGLNEINLKYNRR